MLWRVSPDMYPGCLTATDRIFLKSGITFPTFCGGMDLFMIILTAICDHPDLNLRENKYIWSKKSRINKYLEVGRICLAGRRAPTANSRIARPLWRGQSGIFLWDEWKKMTLSGKIVGSSNAEKIDFLRIESIYIDINLYRWVSVYSAGCSSFFLFNAAFFSVTSLL